MVTVVDSKAAAACPPDMLDRIAIVYLAVPLVIFLLGWLQAWIAVPLALSVVYSLRPLLHAVTPTVRPPLSRLQLCVAIAVGLGWTVLGGTGHLVFANPDWHVRDAVLHDLVASPWPLAYATPDGAEVILRAPLGYYLPAALIGKFAGLQVAHFSLAAWTAIGVIVFLLQVFSLMPARARVI